MTLVSTFWGDEDRRAEVHKNKLGFFVNMFIKDVFHETRPLYDHSESYAEDCAENFVMKWGEWYHDAKS